jgi:DNA-binding transcriptional ArsR family regulator
MAAKATGTARKRTQPNAIEAMVFERQARICKAFASPVRLQILDLVSKGECGATELQVALNITKANLSQHLSILKSAGVVAGRREGKQMFYMLTIPEVKQACQLIRKVLYAQVEDARKMLL